MAPTTKPPDNILVGYDSLTAAGGVKDAAHDMMDVFDAALDLIAANPAVWMARPAGESYRGYSLANPSTRPALP